MLAVFALLPLLCALAAPEPPSAAGPVDLPRVSSASEVGERGLPVVALSGAGAELKPYGRFGATARLAWSAQGLHAQVSVVDATPYEAPDAERLYEGDSVELFLAAPPGGPADAAGMVQLVVSPARDPAHPGVRRRYFDYRGAALKKAGPPAGGAYVRRTRDGYVVDLLLSWSNLGLSGPPAPGAVFGVRVGVNDGEAGRERARLVWVTPSGKAADFFAPPPVRLALVAGAGTGVPAAAAWGDYDDEGQTRVHVVAEPGLAGRTVRVATAAGKVRAEGTLRRDGERAAASLSFPPPPPGAAAEGALTVTLDGAPLRPAAPAPVVLPDIAEYRRGLFRFGVTGEGRRDASQEWVVPAAKGGAVFSGDRFPEFTYADPKRVERLLGPVAVKVAYYDAAGRPVERPSAPGRYGAVVTATAAALGETATGYRTLFRRPDGVAPAADTDPVSAAAALEKAPDAAKADRDWWHTLRKKLGNAIRYEYYVRLPAGYDADPARRWPVIFYLHGSGGGDPANWDRTKVNDGPQGAAGRDPEHFPFVIVSLRSPGGWHPPAVKDVMDEVEAKYRIDTAREYLTGFSMGGMGTWTVVYDQPARFAAIAPVGARTGDPARMPLLKGVAAWVFNGADDSTTTAADARAAVASLRAANTGAEVKYTEIPGAGHVESLTAAYAGIALYDWFLSHHK
jgi:predicted esterase